MSKRKAAKGGAGPERSATPARRAAASSAFDFEAIRELARIAGEFDLAEIEVEPSGRVRVSRGVAVAAAAAPPAYAPPVERPAGAPTMSLVGGSSAGHATPPAPAVDALTITSPFVGTFYRAPSPDAPVFADVGQIIRKGQVVCIVEAMKLMNEIESEFDGKVVEILCKNGDHIEYGQPLFRLEKV